jgi:hypothetical protein
MSGSQSFDMVSFDCIISHDELQHYWSDRWLTLIFLAHNLIPLRKDNSCETEFFDTAVYAVVSLPFRTAGYSYV